MAGRCVPLHLLALHAALAMKFLRCLVSISGAVFGGIGHRSHARVARPVPQGAT